jgi:hypothetical protein
MSGSFIDPILEELSSVRVGDEVTVDGLPGVVRVNFETGEADATYSLSGWGEEPGGLLVSTDQAGLVRLPRVCFEDCAISGTAST